MSKTNSSSTQTCQSCKSVFIPREEIAWNGEVLVKQLSDTSMLTLLPHVVDIFLKSSHRRIRDDGGLSTAQKVVWSDGNREVVFMTCDDNGRIIIHIELSERDKL